MNPAKDHKGDWGTGASVVQGEAKRAGVSREGSGQMLSMCISTWWGEWRRWSQVLLSHKLKYRKFHLSVITKLFCKEGQTVEEVVLGACVAPISPSLEVLKTQLDMTLCNLLLLTLLWADGLTQATSRAAVQPQPPCESVQICCLERHVLSVNRNVKYLKHSLFW